MIKIAESSSEATKQVIVNKLIVFFSDDRRGGELWADVLFCKQKYHYLICKIGNKKAKQKR